MMVPLIRAGRRSGVVLSSVRGKRLDYIGGTVSWPDEATAGMTNR